jgi:hypothetical protein
MSNVALASRWILAALIFILALYLVQKPTQRMVRLWMGQDGIERLKLSLNVDGVPAKWGYACWHGILKEDLSHYGHLYEGGLNETRVSPPALDRNIEGGPLRIGRTTFRAGIGTHAPSKIAFSLDGKVGRFSCQAGLDAVSANNYGVVFFLVADGQEIFRSPKLKTDADPFPIDVPVAGVKELVLGVDNCEFDNTLCDPDWVDLNFKP